VKRKRKKSKHGPRTAGVDKRIVEELAKWGIDKKTVGAAALTILITAILRLIGVGASRIPGEVEMSEEDFRVEDVIAELKEENVLDTFTSRVAVATLKKAVREIVADDGLIWDYDVDDIPLNYSKLINKDLLEFLKSHPRQ